MGKFRTKLKGQTKGKRWPKGQSSSSNPETRKHRDLAKSRFFQENIGCSNLTSDALRKHDATQFYANPSSTPSDVSEMETELESSNNSSFKSSYSFASEWSNCSNMSYNRFLKVFRSDSALHKEMLAVLAAISEVINENGGSGTAVEYYCALITTLDKLLEAAEKNEDQITAVLSLLNMGIRGLPEPVLKKGFNEVSLKLMNLLNVYSSAENNIIIKSIMGILSVLLRAQELAIWTHSTTKQMFSAILNPFCIHSKPKWRKAAQEAVARVVDSEYFLQENVHNVAADLVANFCEDTLNMCMGGTGGAVVVSSVQAGQTTILHTLGLMKDTIRYFSHSHMKKCSEIILRLMTLNYPIVTSCSLQVLHSLFTSQKAVVPAKLNGQLIAALYDYQPSLMDAQPTSAWLTVLQQAHVHLIDVDLAMGISALPKIFSTTVQLWLSQKPEVATSATYTLELLLKDAISAACTTSELAQQYNSQLSKCFTSLQMGLTYQYNNVWHQVLHVIKVMFDVAGKTCGELLFGCLKTLAELRDSYKFSYNNELEHAVGAAVRSMGPENVLRVISLKKENGELNMDRSWLLPVLKQNVKGSTLNYWVNNILPMAIFCHRQSVQLSERNDGIGAHSAELLYVQLWDLLHSFCNTPTDIKDSFKSIAKVMGTAISDRKELRLVVMASLRRLIASAKESENAEDLAEIARFDKNYLPILFNLYTTRPVGTDEEGQRLAALDTVKAYLTVAKPELCKQLFDSALDRLDTSSDPDELFLKESVLDLIRALIHYQDADSVNKLFEKCIKGLPEIKNHKEQKKAYRLLEEICRSDTQGCRDFIKAHMKLVQKLLLKSLNSVLVSSKGARLRCLNYLVKAQPHLDHESKLLRSVIPEAVLCCKDINQKCRAIAYDLLNSVGETLLRHNQMQEFVTMLLAGLTGTVQMMSCTVLALASMLHNFSGTLGQANIQFILENVATLSASTTREVVSSCLSFVKVYCTSLPSPQVAASLDTVMKSLTNMNEDCKRHFRLKVRDILDRLVRKYSFEAVVQHVPTSDGVMYKRLRNLRKLNARKKKLKEQKLEDESENIDEFIIHSKPKSMEEILADSDSESEFEDNESKSAISKKNKPGAWIEEDENSIVDFTDPSVISKITATKPGKAPIYTEKPKKDRGFKTAPDGRLIIADDDDDDSDSQHDSGKINLDSDSDSDNNSIAETLVLSDRKRKRSQSVKSSKSISSFGSQPPMKYKTGGIGIHRNTSTSKGSGSEYKSKKALGDVKKKGKPDPYAYLPLQRTVLNKRKRMKATKQFKNIIKGAKSGVLKGAKAKRNRKK